MAQRVLIALCLLALPAAGCRRKAIPARPSKIALHAKADPSALLHGGTLIFSDNFNRATLGPNWKTSSPDWTIVKGELHSLHPRNKGIWLMKKLPANIRVEFDAHSDPLPSGKTYPGDIKCEIFASKPAHQAGYSVINGGWHNQLDVIARLGEHGRDRKAQSAAKVAPKKVYAWAVARKGSTLYWFRDGKLMMSYPDATPLEGPYFGFNNWETNVFYDNLKIYKL